MKYGITRHRRASLATDLTLLSALLAGGAALVGVLTIWITARAAIAAASVGILVALGVGHAVAATVRGRLPW